MRPRQYAYSHLLIIAMGLFLLCSSCGSGSPSAPPALPTVSVTGPSTGWLDIYFTDPTGSLAHNYTGGPDQSLAEAIDQARLSVDVAAYSLNLWSIRDALLRAHRRGVDVRMVMESDNMDNEEVQAVLAAGIPILGDRREGLMHDKFVIIDHAEVWTGSMNFTVASAYKDNNNLLHIRSQQAAQDFTTEFQEMFLDDKFGPQIAAETPYPLLTLDGTRVEIYFSPDDGVAERILELIQAARHSISFLAFSFTSDDIGGAIRDRARQGVRVEGVMDAGQILSNPGTEFDQFQLSGLDVRKDSGDGSMHHKVIIVDESIVITGSYNFTASAETQNDENVVIIFNPEVAARYLEEFQRVYQPAQP